MDNSGFWARDMRIIGGEFKGRVIDMPRQIRPTSDKAREALFEILKPRIEGASFLDIYCGSGAIGIEAFSRGAKGIDFIDNNPICINKLKKNLAGLGIMDTSSINIYNMDALLALRHLEENSRLYDIIFMDPPYYRDIARNALIALSNYAILTPNVVIVAETHKKDVLPEEIGMLAKARVSRYGDTKLEFFEVIKHG